ncbi:uncharacterized protein LOC108117463 [Drosophila eugracilis]|uniref:uncharacterized protein LOC108117463 n=1 Tax=Drosophila eugracilis TaxID=29029 RepID=UPI0007E85FFF|nr:uncharacterized protein LOC108117463 [Drosophila eugracilis]
MVLICSRIEFTKLKCISSTKDLAIFEYCILNKNNRTSSYVSAKLKVFKLPVRSVKVNLGLYQLINGCRPFLYNITVDYCKFLKNQKANPIAKYFNDLLKDVSNFNHSCPYNHDFIVDKLSPDIVNTRLPKTLPFPEGRYMIETIWMGDENYRAVTKLYFLFINT